MPVNALPYQAHQSAGAGELSFYGRGPQLKAMENRLRESRGGASRLVVVEGPPGIGKTALVRRFLRTADRVRVLEASGAENETALAYGVLTQLLRQTAVGEYAPRPQDEPGVAGARLLALADQIPADTVIVVVIDDAHWADAPSLDALTFVLRRLQCEPVLTLLAVHGPEEAQLPKGMGKLLADDETLRLTLDGLTAEQTGALCARLLPTRLPPHAVGRLHAHTRGNPLHLRALLREVEPEVLASSDSPLPAPRSYQSLVRDRLAHCDPPARDLVAAASVLGLRATLHRVAQLAGLENPLPAVEQAVGQGLLDEYTAGGPPELAFPQPLIQAAVYHLLGPARRAALHTRAVQASKDTASRTWHQLLAGRSPDPALVADLATGARRQAAAGHWSRAASMAAHASRLATTRPERERLTVEAADALLCDGRVEEAADLVRSLPGDAARAAHRYAHGHLAFVRGETPSARLLLDDAWRHCDPALDPALARRIAERLAYVCLIQGEAAAAVRWAQRAGGLPPVPFTCGMLRYAQLAALGLTGAAEEGIARAAGLPESVLVQSGDVDLLLGRSALRLGSDDLEGSRADLRSAAPLCRSGPAPQRAMAQLLLGETELRLGNWDVALRELESAAQTTAARGLAWLEPVAHADLAGALALRGLTERAAEYLARARASSGYGHGASGFAHVARAQAQLAAARGAPDEVASALLPLLERESAAETVVAPWRDLLVDALTALGEHRQAERILDGLDAPTAHRGRHSQLAAAARARGTLLAARRSPAAAEWSFRKAIGHAEQVPDPFNRARVHLAYGVFLRRAGKRTDAAGQLRRALRTFTELGAAPSAAHCERELAAIGGAIVPDSPLTPQELAIARLATSGLTNRQIARHLVLSVKTVEFHLSHAYTKLGITSRMGLLDKLPTTPAP
ncbi:LuxR family transcriptional regulator [Streptomyces coacervatus]|uniref:LuxR family transcriptional regulator n=1 Tax=Streptomyces coacervatus TaxID=647381 RepID=A0ABP7IDN8_9ACTN|nr:AAA family ATPase [Streptomyces coacervatus]MDF2268984.1 AAA family ATPase [Streptomyces coacervatus]